MEKTILIGLGQPIANNASLNFRIGVGVFYLLLPISSFLFVPDSNISRFGYLIILGFWSIVGAFFAFSKKSLLAPRVVIGEEFIRFKAGLLRKYKSIEWHQVSAIHLGENMVEFSKKGGSNELIHYRTLPRYSLQIKAAIREIAETKQVTVTP